MRKPELRALTGIRSYLAWCVLCAHIPDLPGLMWLREEHVFFAQAGKMGVSVFFVLSGFILNYNYADSFQHAVTPTNYAKFIWDRFAKVYPTHLVTLLMALPLQILSPNLPLDWRAIPYHLMLAQCIVPFAEPRYYAYLNFPSWSISCEWFFYLLAPVTFWLLVGGRRRNSARWICCLVYLIVVCFYLWRISKQPSREYFIYYFAPSRFLEFLGGAFVGSHYLRFGNRLSESTASVVALIGIALLGVGMVIAPGMPWIFQGGILYLPGAALLIDALAHERGALARHLSSNLLNLLGMASFALYMLHQPIIRCVRGALLKLGQHSPSVSVQILAVVAVCVLTQIAAILMFRYWEVPLQKRLRGWLYTRFLAPERKANG